MGDEHLDRLLAELDARAKSELAEAMEAGAAEAERVRSDARANAVTRAAEALSACDAEQAQVRASAVADARRRGRGALLEAQHAFVERVLSRAATIIGERIHAAGPEALRPRVKMLLSYASKADPCVQLDDCGIRVVADEGHLRIDDTVATWLRQNRAELAIVICRAAEQLVTAEGKPC